jgi:hypothetical protein
MIRCSLAVVLAAVVVLAVALALAGCGRADRSRSAGGTCAYDRAGAAAVFTEVPVDTAPGLSGLAADAAGGIWTIAERDARAYRITLDAALHPRIEMLAVEGVPPRSDLEGIAVLGTDRFAIGIEGRRGGTATVLLAARRGGALAVTGQIELTEREVGLPLEDNHGAEGICGAGDTVVAAIEGAGAVDGKRWAPFVRIERGAVARTHRLWLTTATGKISGIDCQVRPDGSITGWAIERHFEVTRLLRFELPPPGAGPDESAGDITPTVALDLSAVLGGCLNLEGIARLPDGRLVAVVDNQYKETIGPSMLLVFRPGALSAPSAPPPAP